MSDTSVRAGTRERETTKRLDLAVVVPTFEEARNVEELVRRLRSTLGELNFEMIFVDDDSPDGTAERVRDIALADPRVRCIQRVGRRGLSSACIEGMMATAAPFIAVMDGDLQHEERLLPEMLAALRHDETLDLVVGSRYAAGGGFGAWGEGRKSLSRLATRIARLVTKVDVQDPMSGFFMLRAATLRGLVRDLSAVGFKLLLDILVSSDRPLRVKELPYEFRLRKEGESKLGARVALEFFEMLVEKTIGRYVPAKFVMFSIVGSLGVVVHMTVLGILFGAGGLDFQSAQITATLVAMSFNFFLNNIFTHHERRLTGWRLLPGLLSFCAASSIGAIANVGISVYLFRSYDALWFWSAIAGSMVGVVWNYSITSIFTWTRRV